MQRGLPHGRPFGALDFRVGCIPYQSRSSVGPSQRLKYTWLTPELCILRITNAAFTCFTLVITNTSLAANSIKQVTLSLEYRQSGQPPSNATVPHDSNAASMFAVGAPEVLRVPSPIAAGGTVSGAAAFNIATTLLGDGAVESYTVTVLDAHDRRAHCQAILLRESPS